MTGHNRGDSRPWPVATARMSRQQNSGPLSFGSSGASITRDDGRKSFWLSRRSSSTYQTPSRYGDHLIADWKGAGLLLSEAGAPGYYRTD